MKKITMQLNDKKNLYVLLVTLLLLFLLLELFIRSNLHMYCYGCRPSNDDKIIYELQPNYRIVSLNAEICSQGLADRFFSLNKPLGIYRIAVIGDSGSFGWMVGPQNSFPKLLEKMLNEKQGKNYEVINFSVPGYNTSQELELLQKKVIKFNPDMVILNYCDNDMYICNYIKPKINFLNYLYNKSFMVHFLLRRIDRKLTYTRFHKIWLHFKKNILGMYYYEQLIYPYPGLEETIYINNNPPAERELVPRKYWYMLGLENYRIHLYKFIAFLKENNIEFISSGLFDKDGSTINRKLGIQNICDFSDFFSRDRISYSEVRLSNSDPHMNRYGHRLCAGYLYETILSIIDRKNKI